MKKILMLNNVFMNDKLLKSGEIIELSDTDISKLSLSQYLPQEVKVLEVKNEVKKIKTEEVKEVK